MKKEFMGNLKVILTPIYVMGTPMRRAQMEINEILGSNLHRVYLEDTGTGFTTNIILNGGGEGADDWLNPTSGVAEYWTAIGDAKSIVTGNGFTGNAQRINRTLNPQLIILATEDYFGITTALGKEYKIWFKYRSEYPIYVQAFSNLGGGMTIITVPSNTGDASGLMESTWVHEFNDFDYIQFLVPTQASDSWMEIDEVTVKEILR